MKTKGRRPSNRRQRFDSDVQVYTLSQAKAFLGRLADKARSGAPVYIICGRQRFILQEVPEIMPIPLRPEGYFAYEKEDITLDKKLSAATVNPRRDSL